MADRNRNCESCARLRVERDGLLADINGCSCPAPYDTCPHDEPLLRQIERLRVERDTALAEVETFKEWRARVDGEISRLRDELERAYLKAVRDADLITFIRSERDEARAEFERLRTALSAALHELADDNDCPGEGCDICGRAALSPVSERRRSERTLGA